MRRLPIAFTAIVLTFALVGCNHSPSPHGSNTGSGGSEESASAPLRLSVRQEYDSEWGGETGAGYYIKKEYLVVEDESASVLQNAIDEFNEELATDYETQISEMKGVRLLEKEESDEANPVEEYEESHYENKLLPMRADHRILSVLKESEGNLIGGAYPDRVFFAATFDVKTGKRLTLEDVAQNMDILRDELMTELNNSYGDRLIQNWEETLQTMLEEDGLTFLLGNPGLVFLFNPFELAPGAQGILQVTFPYEDAEEIIREEYICDSDEYSIALPSFSSISVDLEGDGEAEEISVSSSKDEYYYEDVSVTVGGEAVSEDAYFYDFDSYLLHTKRGDYIYVDTTSDNDYHTVYVFEIEDHTPRFVGSQDAGIAGSFEESDAFLRGVLTDSSAFCLSTKIDLLSTYHGVKTYRVGGDGMPETEDEYYEVEVYYTLKAAKPFSLEVLSDDLEPTGETEEIPVGRELTIIRSDGETVVDLCDEDGKYYRAEVYLDDSDYWQTIDGESIEDLFEMTYFAG